MQIVTEQTLPHRWLAQAMSTEDGEMVALRVGVKDLAELFARLTEMREETRVAMISLGVNSPPIRVEAIDPTRADPNRLVRDAD